MPNSLLEIAIGNVLVASVLALAAILVTRLWKSSQVAHLLWLLVLTKLITPPLWQVQLPALLRNPSNVASTILPVESSDASGLEAARAVISLPGERNYLESDSEAFSPFVHQVKPQDRTDLSRSGLRTFIATTHEWLQLANRSVTAHAWMITLTWLAASASWAILIVVRVVRFNRTLSHTLPADEKLIQLTRKIAKRLNLEYVPTIRLADAAIAPMVWPAAWRVTLVLPQRLVDELSDEQLSMILAHELAHLKRFDHLVRFLEVAVVTIYWWNPIAWWARRKLHAAEEACCDSRVMQLFPTSAVAYGDLLLRTNQFLLSGRVAVPSLASGFRGAGSLKRRIAMILNEEFGSPISRTMGWTLTILAICILPVTARGILAEDESPKATPTAAKDEAIPKALENATPVPKGREPVRTLPAPANLNFEDGVRDDGFPNRWFGGGDGYKLAVDAEIFHQGAGSGRIERVADGGTFGSLTSGTSAVPYRGKRVKYIGFLRSRDADTAGLWMRVDGVKDGVRTPLAFDNMSDRAVRGTTDWKKYAIVLDVASDATSISFGFLLQGKGVLWGDDLKLKVVNDVDGVPKTTGLDQEAIQRANDALKAGGTTNLQNLDFEAGAWGGGVPKWWSGGGSDSYVRSIDTGKARQGTASGRIERVADGGRFGSLTRSIPANEFLSKRIKYSGFLSTENAESAALWMRIDTISDGKIEPIDFDNTAKQPLTGTADWAERTIVLDVPEDAKHITFGLISSGAGIVWGDGLKIEVVGEIGEGPETTGFGRERAKAINAANRE